MIWCYNHGPGVLEALNSALKQTFSRVEVIIVDNESSDAATLEALKSLPNTVVLHQSKGPLSRALNAAIHRARGKWVCWLAADARLAPTFLEKCLFLLETDGSDICGTLSESPNQATESLDPGPFSLQRLMRENCMSVVAVFRTELWKQVGGYDPRVPSGGEDWEFWIRLAKAGARGTLVPEPLFWDRKDTSAMVPGAIKQHREILAYIRQHHSDCFTNPAKVLLVDEAQNLPPQVWPYSNMLPSVASRRSKPVCTILVAMPFLSIGGGEASVSRICAHLSQWEFRFVIIATQSPQKNQGDCTPWFESTTPEIFPLPQLAHWSRFANFLDYLIESRPIDIVWQVGSRYIYNQLPRLKQRFPRLKVVDLLFNPVGHTASFLKYNYLIDHVVTEHLGMKDWLLARGESDETVSVIPNGVDLRRFRPEPRASWKNKRGLPQSDANRFVVGFFGRLSEEKGPDLFVNIADRLRERTDIEFLIAGEGHLEIYVQASIASLGLVNAHFLGFVTTEEYLPCCDALVVCSRLDGRPNIVMESQAMGVPVIASRVGGLPEMMADGHSGILVDPLDIDGFARAILGLVEDSVRHEQMRRSARSFAEQHFSLDLGAEQYAELFRALLRTERGTQHQRISANGTV